MKMVLKALTARINLAFLGDRGLCNKDEMNNINDLNATK
jgi:hypothetical protein